MDQEKTYFLTPKEYRVRLKEAGLQVADSTLRRWTFAGYVTPPVGPKHKARYCLESVGDVGALTALWGVIGERQPSGATMRAIEFVRAHLVRPDAIEDFTAEMKTPRMRWSRPVTRGLSFSDVYELRRSLIGGNQTVHAGALTALCAYWKAVAGFNVKTVCSITQIWSDIRPDGEGREGGTLKGALVMESTSEEDCFTVGYGEDQVINEQKFGLATKKAFIAYPFGPESIRSEYRPGLEG